MVPERSQKEPRHCLQRNFRTVCPPRPGWLPLETILPSPCRPYILHRGFGHASLPRSYFAFRPRLPIPTTSCPEIRIPRPGLFVNHYRVTTKSLNLGKIGGVVSARQLAVALQVVLQEVEPVAE